MSVSSTRRRGGPGVAPARARRSRPRGACGAPLRIRTVLEPGVRDRRDRTYVVDPQGLPARALPGQLAFAGDEPGVLIDCLPVELEDDIIEGRREPPTD